MGDAGLLSLLARRWWVGLVILLVAGATVAGIVALRGGPAAGQVTPGAAALAGRELVTVHLQTLTTEVPLEGRLVFPNTAELTFHVARGIAGKVGDVAVAPGQRVQQGQLLASMDATSRTSLETVVAEAKLRLDHAQDALETASERFATTPVEKAQFEQEIADGRVALDNAQDELDDFLTDDNQSLAKVQFSQDDAQVALDDAQKALADFDVDYQKELTGARKAKADAETALEAAEDALTSIIGTLGSSRVTDTDVWDHLPRLQSTVEAARASLAKAKEDLARLETGPDELKLRRLKAAVTVAQTTLAKAQTQLGRQAAGPDAAELAAKQKKVATLQRKLDELLNGPESLVVALRTAEVAHARAAVADALKDLEGANVRAPFAGVVALVNAEVDDIVTKDSPIVTLVNPGQVQIDGHVGGAELRLVQLGAKARVTIASLTGAELDGVVTFIAAEPRTERGVITYAVTIQVIVPPGLEVPVAPSGVTVVVLNELKNALAVPRRAVFRAERQPAVSVLNGQGALEERRLVLGDGNGEWVTVRQGLNQGDQVVLPLAVTPQGAKESKPSSG